MVNRLDERRSRPDQRFGQQSNQLSSPTKVRPESHRPPTARCGSVRVEFETLVNLTVDGGSARVASPSNVPSRIVQGADGAIWFTEGNKIGRYDPVGLGLQEVAVPSAAPPSTFAPAERKHLVHGQQHEFQRVPNHGILRKLYRQPVQRRSRRELARHRMRRRQRRLVRRQREQRHRPNLSKRRQQPNDVRHTRRKTSARNS